MNMHDLQCNRVRIRRKLRKIKEEAYSDLTYREYESICSLIHYIETLMEIDRMKMNGGK